MKLIILLFSFVISLPVFAAEKVGRLFFSADERALLDNARRQKIKLHEEPAPAAVTATIEPPRPAPPPENLSVSGVVKRSDGVSTVWINKKPVDGKSEIADGKKLTGVFPGGKVVVRHPEDKRKIVLKVGQHFDESSRAARENYAIPLQRFEPKPEAGEPLEYEEPAPEYEEFATAPEERAPSSE
jgi:hypothetical protein